MVIFAELPLNERMAEELGELKIDFAFQPIFKKKTMELATFLGASKAYYDRNLKGMLSINSFPSECFDPEESAVFFRCFPHVAGKMFVEILEYTDLNFDKWVLKREQIRSNGIRISLDDYGSGNNYMMAVNIFEPDEVKNDRSLISGIHLDKVKQKHFVELVEKFHKRGIHALAEGVECKEELDFLLTTDVDYLQGYYLGMPE